MSFSASERLSLYFFSPNVCGTFLGMVFLLGMGLAHYWQQKKHSEVYSFFSVFIFVLSIIVLAGFLNTYSRGGYIALCVALFYVSCFYRIRLEYKIAFVIAVVLMPMLIVRFFSSFNFFADDSILHRVYLWKGACGLIWESPMHGIRWGGAYYHAWYQPLSFDDNYRTMISDTLTLGVKYGFWSIVAYDMIHFLPLTGLLWLKNVNFREKTLLASLAGCILFFYVAGLFSTMYEFFMLELLWGGIYIMLSILIIRCKRFLPHIYQKSILFSIILTASHILLVFTVGFCVSRAKNYNVKYIYKSFKRMVPDMVVAKPLNGIKENICCFIDIDDFGVPYGDIVIRDIVRPCLKKGYASIIVPRLVNMENQLSLQDELKDLLSSKEIVICYKDSFELLLSSLSLLNDNCLLVLINPVAVHPIEEMSVMSHIGEVASDIIIVYSEEFSHDALALYNERLNCGKKVSMRKFSTGQLSNIIMELIKRKN